VLRGSFSPQIGSTDHLKLPDFKAVYFNTKYGKSGGEKRTQKQRKEAVTKFLKL